MAHDKLEKIADEINILMDEYKSEVDKMSKDMDTKHITCMVAIYHPNDSTWMKVIRE